MLAASVIKLHSTFFNSTFPGLISSDWLGFTKGAKALGILMFHVVKNLGVFERGYFYFFFCSLISISLGVSSSA